MPSDWKHFRWGDLATLEYGKGITGYENSTGAFPVYGTNGRIGFHTEVLYDAPGVVIGRKGAYRGVHYSKVPFFVIDTAFYLKPKVEFDMHWAYYQLLTQDINSMDSGSAIPSTSRPDFYALPVTVPPPPEQGAIADVLGSLDDKIELNRRMNATLESMARAVFKAWFMENEEAKGWKIGQIKDLGDVVCGKTPPTNDKENYDGDIPFITIPDMHNKVFITQTRKTLSEKGAQTQSKKTLPVFAICVSCIATPGLVSLTTKPSQTNQQINNLVPNDKKSVFYCYYALRALADEIRARGSGGSVVVNLNKGQFEILPVVIPPATKLHEFQEQVEPLFLRLLANENESRTLAALRDALLPRLMSGEVRVGEG